MKCVQALVNGCGDKFHLYVDQSLLDLIFTSLEHPNRFVREPAYQTCATIIEVCSGQEQINRRTEAFFLGCKIGGVRIWLGVEIFPQHAVFIAQHAVFFAQQILDQILRICKSFLKSGFFGHILFPLFQNQSTLYLQ